MDFGLHIRRKLFRLALRDVVDFDIFCYLNLGADVNCDHAEARR